jgi:hypothetical protein
MKIAVRNTLEGLIPIYPSDLTEKQRLKLGEDYECEIHKARNIHFHKKFFALVKCAWLNLPEHLDERFPHPEVLRKVLQIEAGFYNVYYLLDGTEIREAQSIAFDKMDQAQFEEVYNKVLDIILQKVLIGTTASEINPEILSFL